MSYAAGNLGQGSYRWRVADQEQRDNEPEIQPGDFLRALLKISPEDAESVRERTPGTRPEKPRQDGPTGDYGDTPPVR